MVRIAILRLVETYFRHRWLYLVPIVLLALGGAVSVLYADPSYIAGGIIYVQQESFLGNLTSVRDDPFSYKTPAQVTSAEIMDLVQTDAFVRSIIQSTRLESEMSKGEAVVNEVMNEVRSSIWTQTIGDNQVRINALSDDPVLASELGTAVIDRYIQWQINLDQVQSSAAEDFMDDLVVTYSDDLEFARAELRDFLETHPEPFRGDRPEAEQLEISRLEGILALAGARYARALEKQEDARLATSQAEADVRQTYFVVDAPHIPTKPAVSLRQQAMNALIFVILGVIIASAMIVGSALIDRSFRFSTDLEHALALPVLSMVPDKREKPGGYAFFPRFIRLPRIKKRNEKVNNSLSDEEVIEATA